MWYNPLNIPTEETAMRKYAVLLLAVFTLAVVADAQVVRVRSRQPKTPPGPLHVESLWWTARQERSPYPTVVFSRYPRSSAEAVWKNGVSDSSRPVYTWAMATGRLRNTTDKTYERITVTVGVYNARTKDRIGTATARIDTLPAGATTIFTAEPGALYTDKRVPVTKCYLGIVEKVEGTEAKPKPAMQPEVKK
jgi:hypothetical protein